MRVLVIGGSGFLGRHVVAALHRTGIGTVVIGSRRPENIQTAAIYIDLTKPETFDSLSGFDYTVNCASATSASPSALIEYCLLKGHRLLETSADPETVDKVLQKWRRSPPVWPCAGFVLLGIGLFPGLSNVMATAVREQMDPTNLEIAIRLSPLSGGGEGLVDMMLNMLHKPAIHVADGTLVQSRGFERGPSFRIGGSNQPTLRAPIAEPIMLHITNCVQAVSGYLSLRPRALTDIAIYLTTLYLRLASYRHVIDPVLRFLMRTVRGRLLGRTPTPVDIFVIADRGHEDERSLRFRTEDGLRATGVVCARAICTLSGRPPSRGGVFLPDELFQVSDLCVRSQNGELRLMEDRKSQAA